MSVSRLECFERTCCLFTCDWWAKVQDILKERRQLLMVQLSNKWVILLDTCYIIQTTFSTYIYTKSLQNLA